MLHMFLSQAVVLFLKTEPGMSFAEWKIPTIPLSSQNRTLTYGHPHCFIEYLPSNFLASEKCTVKSSLVCGSNGVCSMHAKDHI